ncbi:hypothetical protein [Chryseobacterium sp. ERMR1:04]|uniref:hypothetical protein n=1 Tax=Chryseobacterium sp. ERMR1:04 TaxID=1705393 RepID=UPI0006C852C0|nr:hypothetical protein [Chryseobacterium sp. ERMR1:04]
MQKNLNQIKNWDWVTTSLLGLSILIIIFSFFAPYILTINASKSDLDFTGTGQIGDTLGGIMNPFIALGGVFLTFLAFYMQIKANQIQIGQFNEGISNEKVKKIRDEKISSYYNLSLLAIDLEDIVNDINEKTDKIKQYIELEKRDDLFTNILYRTTSRKYSRILETDRLEIYKGFVFFLLQEENWLKKYSKLYNILDFLPELFETIYAKYDSHSKDLFEKKMLLRSELSKLMDSFAQLVNDYNARNLLNYLNISEVKISNEALLNYYHVINGNFDENNNPISETDFNKINEKVLEPFLQDALFIRNNKPNYDRNIEPLIEKIANIRKDIKLLKNRKFEFSISLEKEYKTLIEDTNNQRSIIFELTEIKEDIKTITKDINPEKI